MRLAAYGESVEGTPFGRYRLIELLGRGGMGEVWRAHDTDTDRIVAIKVLPAHLSDNEDFKQRFRREAHAAAGLNTPHVIPIHHYGEIDGRLYLDMRLIDGRDLQTALAAGPLEPTRAVRIIEQVALALHAAHKVGLVHRDVKPSNILLDENDFAYLIDFGIARAADETRLTKSGNMIGTFQYIAPERLGTRAQEDARADIYSLACVLYECLTGSPPFGEDTMARLIAAHLSTPPPRPSRTQRNVPPQVDDVIARGMAKDPDQRYATTVELADAARDAITVPIPRPRPTVGAHPPTRPVQRTSGGVQNQHTQLAAAGAAPALPPPPRPPQWQPPPQHIPPPKRPGWRRPRAVIPAVMAVVLLIGGGVFAAVKVTQPHRNPATIAAQSAPPSPSPQSAPPPSPSAPPPPPPSPSAPPPPPPSPAAPPQANGFALPGCYNSTDPPADRPMTHTFVGCTSAGGWIQDMSWTSWGPEGAEGTGIAVYKVCQPSCASGYQLAYSTVVHAWNPQPAAASAGCPADLRIYADMVLAFPKSVPPPTVQQLNTQYNGMPAAHYTNYQVSSPTDGNFIGRTVCT
jgi:serine/threonine protein kinase